MDLTRVLIALFPKDWRRDHGDEFRMLLDESRLTASDVVDTVRFAAVVRARASGGVLLLVMAALVSSACCEITALRENLTANILWAPTNPMRTLVLAALLAPWAGLLARQWLRRTARLAS